MEQATLHLSGPRISRVTIGRLHNLGNYEHVRFEVTVELPPGTSPASVIGEMTTTLDDMDPKPPVDLWDLKAAIDMLAKPPPVLAAADPDDPFTNPQTEYERAVRRRETAVEKVARHEAWRKTHAAALQRFDQFGGTAVRTDAKDSWDQDDQP